MATKLETVYVRFEDRASMRGLLAPPHILANLGLRNGQVVDVPMMWRVIQANHDEIAELARAHKEGAN